MTRSWLEEERAKARKGLEATAEGRRLLAHATEVLESHGGEAGSSAWQKAFAESQAVLHAQLASERKKGLILLPLEEAARTHEALVRAHWPQGAESLASLLTLAVGRHGTFIFVPEGLAVETILSPWPALTFADEIFSLQIAVVESGAKASILSGCVQEKSQLGSLRAASAVITVGQRASLEWITLDHLTSTADGSWRRFTVADNGQLTWRLVRLADPGPLFPVEIRGPVRWEGIIVPRAGEELLINASEDLAGEVLVFQNPATSYNIRAGGEGSVPWSATPDRARLVSALQSFPMEYAIEAEMVLDRLI